ncbi:MAG TPA: hypothetical protein VIL52_03205 [Bacteroidota bacterium]
MTCQEVREVFGTAIDGVLHSKTEGLFRQHLGACVACRTAFELETMAKHMVRVNVKRALTPPHLYERIVQSLYGGEERAVSRAAQWWDRVLTYRVVTPALTTAAAVVVLYLLFAPGERFESGNRHTAENDIINQSVVNFALIQSGELKPTLVSCSPEGVVGYFERNNMHFTVNVKSLEDCDWYGATTSDYNGVKLAHIVYKIGDDLMYVYQVKEEELQDGSLLQLPPAAKKSLAETRWYNDPDHPDCSIVVWKTNNGVLNTAVSTMKKDRLLALLTTN